MNGDGNGATLAKQLQSFVAAGGVSAIVMAVAAAWRAWQQANPAHPASVAPPTPLEAENARLRERLTELEKDERK